MISGSSTQIKEMLKAADVANVLGVSKSLVYHLMRENKIKYVQIGNAKRVRRVDLEKYIEEHLSG